MPSQPQRIRPRLFFPANPLSSRQLRIRFPIIAVRQVLGLSICDSLVLSDTLDASESFAVWVADCAGYVAQRFEGVVEDLA